MTRPSAWLAALLFGLASATLTRPAAGQQSANPKPDAQMLLDLDLLRDADLARDRSLLARMRLIERLRMLEALPALDSETQTETPPKEVR